MKLQDYVCLNEHGSPDCRQTAVDFPFIQILLSFWRRKMTVFVCSLLNLLLSLSTVCVIGGSELAEII